MDLPGCGLLLLLFPSSSQGDFRKGSWSEPGTEESLRTSGSKVWFWNCLVAAETTVVGCKIVVCIRLALGPNVVFTRRAL